METTASAKPNQKPSISSVRRHLWSALPQRHPSALTSFTLGSLKHDPPAAHADLRRLGPSWVSPSGRLTASCSVILKITLHEAEACKSKFNYDTKPRRCLNLIVLLTLPVRQQKTLPFKEKRLLPIDLRVLNYAPCRCTLFTFEDVLLRRRWRTVFDWKLEYLIRAINNRHVFKWDCGQKQTYTYTLGEVSTWPKCVHSPLQQQQQQVV